MRCSTTASLSLVLLGLGCGGEPPPAVPTPPSPPPRPNVLLLTLDTLRADALPVFGNKVVKTPVINKMAKESTRFSRAYTVTPLTIPSHSSIFTGMYPPRHGVRDNGDFFLGDDAVTLAERLKGAGYATMASVGAEVTSHHWGFAQGFDAFYDDMGVETDDVANRWRVERRGDEVVDDALGWLEANGQTAPWFAWVHLFDAHYPYDPPEPFATTHKDLPYLGEVSYLDLQVGRVMAWLESSGQLDHTLVVLTADHGEGLGAHGEAFHGVLVYDPTTRIPIIIRPPGGQGTPGLVRFPVSVVDLTPTILGAVGLSAAERLDGVDLSPWIGAAEPPPAPEAREIYVESLYPYRHYGWAPQRALVSEEWKLIDSTTPELYARTDAGESDNLAVSETPPPELAAMRAAIRALAATLTPEDDMADAVQLDPERLAQLEALGYVTTLADSSADGFEAGLPDPVERLPSLRELERARAGLQTGNLADALAATQALIAAEPGLLETRALLAQIQGRMGDLEGSLRTWQEIDDLRPSSNARAAMGHLRLTMGEATEGRRLLREALDIDPYLSSAWTAYLRALFMSGELAALEDALKEARSRLPDLVVIDALEGVLTAVRGDAVGAELMLQGVLSRDPMQPFVNHGLGLLARQRGDDAAAEAHLLEETRLGAALASRRALVEIYAEQRRYDEQVAQLELISRSDPTDMPTWHSLAQALYNLQRYDEALPAVETCVDLGPTYPACAMLQANVLAKLGRPEDAEAAYQRALTLAGQR